MDNDGRMVLSQEFRDFAGITDEAVFTGLGSTFQIWSPERRRVHKANGGGTAGSLSNMRIPRRRDS